MNMSNYKTCYVHRLYNVSIVIIAVNTPSVVYCATNNLCDDTTNNVTGTKIELTFKFQLAASC